MTLQMVLYLKKGQLFFFWGGKGVIFEGECFSSVLKVVEVNMYIYIFKLYIYNIHVYMYIYTYVKIYIHLLVTFS